jgi:propionate CoA-transferase
VAKVVRARDAVALIRSGVRVATSGFVGIGFAENIAIALENRFVDSAGTIPTVSGIHAT